MVVQQYPGPSLSRPSTHELFDLIIELQPSLAPAGLAGYIHRMYHFPLSQLALAGMMQELHLLEYRCRLLEYVA